MARVARLRAGPMAPPNLIEGWFVAAMIQSDAVEDPVLRWGWTVGPEILLLGVLNCGLVLEANRRPDRRSEVS